MDDGWQPLNQSSVYQKNRWSMTFPNYHWWQIRKKRQFRKQMAQLTPGIRIRFKTPHTFNDDFTVTTIISVNGNTAIGEEKE